MYCYYEAYLGNILMNFDIEFHYMRKDYIYCEKDIIITYTNSHNTNSLVVIIHFN